MTYPVFLPKIYVYNWINIGDMYKISRSLQNATNYYGFTNGKVDTHQMKNSEWGAVAYLTQSKYGRNGTEVTINNVDLGNTPPTVYGITGYAGNEISSGSGAIANSHAWNTAKGKLASSTGNQYGIYDLSGCVWEYVAGYINNNNSSLATYGGRLVTDNGAGTSTKYKSVYAYNTSNDSYDTNYQQSPNTIRKGEAIWETSTGGNDSTGWNGDYSYFPYVDWLFMIRGGFCADGASTGIFAFLRSNGRASYSDGFRPVVCPL